MDAVQKNDNAGVKIIAPLIYFGFFVFGAILQYIFPIPVLLPKIIAWLIGWVIALVSLIVVILGLRVFRAANNPVMPYKPVSSLMIQGVFKLTRNPLYLSLLLLYIGISIFINFWWPIVFVPVLIVMINQLVIAKEEAYLTRRFGKEYQQYCEHVRRWI